MKNVLKWLFYRDDWMPVKVLQGDWINDKPGCVGRAVYELQYSELRSAYRIRAYGDDPYRHTLYIHAVETFNEEIESANALKTVNNILNQPK